MTPTSRWRGHITITRHDVAHGIPTVGCSSDNRSRGLSGSHSGRQEWPSITERSSTGLHETSTGTVIDRIPYAVRAYVSLTS